MNVTYTITWEEFAEQYQNAWPRPNVFPVVVTLLLVLPMIGYGIALAFFAVPGYPVLYAIFIGAPVALAAMAILQWRTGHRTAKKLAVAEKRANYDRSYAGAQSFSFDQEKWTHETEAGKQETPWPALKVASEWKNIIGLAGERSLAVVPKRVLDAASLESLRQLALARGEGGTFRIGVWDHLATETRLVWRKSRVLPVCGNFLGLCALAWFIFLVVRSEKTAGIIWGWGLAATAVLLTLSAQLWYFPLWYATAPRAFRAPQIFEFSGRGVRISNQSGDSFLAWNNFPKFHETRRAFVLYLNQSSHYLLVKNCVSADQQAHIRQMLQAKVKQD